MSDFAGRLRSRIRVARERAARHCATPKVRIEGSDVDLLAALLGEDPPATGPATPPVVNGVNLVMLAAAADWLRGEPGGNVPLPPALTADWLDRMARAARSAAWGADVPGLQLAGQVAQIVVGSAPEPDQATIGGGWPLAVEHREQLLALLDSGPIGAASGERYVRADLIRAAIGEPEPGTAPVAGDPEQPAKAVLALAHAANMHYRYCDDPDAAGCAGCGIARNTAASTTRVLAADGWYLTRLDSWADRCRAAARAAHALRGPDVAAQPPLQSYRYLTNPDDGGEIGELGDALATWVDNPTGENLAAVLAEVGDCGIILDHILDMVTSGAATLPEVMEGKVEQDRPRFGQPRFALPADGDR